MPELAPGTNEIPKHSLATLDLFTKTLDAISDPSHLIETLTYSNGKIASPILKPLRRLKETAHELPDGAAMKHYSSWSNRR